MAGSAIPRIICLVSGDHEHALLPSLARAGVDGFQVRDKSLGGRALAELTRAVIDAVRPWGATVFVNDRVDVALVTRADGVHVGATDLAVADARGLAPRLTIGATCRSREEVEAAAAEGADYAGFGPVYATTSKDGLPEPLGPGAIEPAAGVLPLVAIGGVRPDNAGEVRAAGAHGVAVIGGIWGADEPEAAAQTLVSAVRGASR